VNSICVDYGPTIVGPRVMLNACLTFSWPNNVPFDRETGRTWGRDDKTERQSVSRRVHVVPSKLETLPR
jgi:hypothetical protein